MPEPLSKAHQRTYDAIRGHPTPHNLHWRDVRSLLEAMSGLTEEPNGKLKAVRGDRTLVLHPKQHTDAMTIGELMDIRRFIEDAGAPAPPATHGLHVLVVIDHREARLYRTELSGAVPQRIVPYDPHGAGRFLHDVHRGGDGQRKPEIRSYYESIAQALQGAEQILVFGGGTGASSAMNALLADLKTHHAELSGRIAGSFVVDDHHLSENEVLAKAREFYAKAAPPAGVEVTERD